MVVVKRFRCGRNVWLRVRLVYSRYNQVILTVLPLELGSNRVSRLKVLKG